MFCTKHPMTREQMTSYELPVHEGAPRWKGVHHKEVADLMVSTANSVGLTVLEERWGYGPTPHRMVGALKVRPAENLGLTVPDGLDFEVGLLHANDFSKPLIMPFGGVVKVCTNGMAVGEFVMRKKHTLNLNLREEIEAGFQRFLEGAKAMPRLIEVMRNRDLLPRETNDILIESGRTGVLPWSRIGQVDHEFRNPRHPEFNGRNAWSLYNAFTEVAKKSSPIEQFGIIRKSLIKIQEVVGASN